MEKRENLENINSHAPRERVSWNNVKSKSSHVLPVTLHVSVWVEIYSGFATGTNYQVTLHVSVWVEIYKYDASYFNDTSHAPRERVSWN